MDEERTNATDAAGRLAELVKHANGDTAVRGRLLNQAAQALAADADTERRSKAAELKAEQRARRIKADAAARVIAAKARIEVQESVQAANRAEREAQQAETAALRELRAENRKRLRDGTSTAAPATLSMLVYSAAVGSAIFGQVSVATGRYHWQTWRGLLLAAFIELMALAMATTANRLRLRGERAVAPRILTWVFAGFASGVNVWGHWSDPLMAAGLGVASLGGITLWEIRSSARHRDALRAAGQLGQRIPSLGWRVWLTYPVRAIRAWRLGVWESASPAGARLLEAVSQGGYSRRQAVTCTGSQARQAPVRVEAVTGDQGSQSGKAGSQVPDSGRQAALRQAGSQCLPETGKAVSQVDASQGSQAGKAVSQGRQATSQAGRHKVIEGEVVLSPQQQQMLSDYLAKFGSLGPKELPGLPKAQREFAGLPGWNNAGKAGPVVKAAKARQAAPDCLPETGKAVSQVDASQGSQAGKARQSGARPHEAVSQSPAQSRQARQGSQAAGTKAGKADERVPAQAASQAAGTPAQAASQAAGTPAQAGEGK